MKGLVEFINEARKGTVECRNTDEAISKAKKASKTDSYITYCGAFTFIVGFVLGSDFGTETYFDPVTNHLFIPRNKKIEKLLCSNKNDAEVWCMGKRLDYNDFRF